MPDAPVLIPVPASYKWPSKVLRYRITCPFQRLLIVKHEAQIDWSGHRIESAEALDRYLREVMLPGLKDCITPGHPKSHYCNGIHLERMLANPAPHINEARKIQQREGDEAARQFLLGHINRHKKEHFEGWWHYLIEGNPLYKQHPAFQYLVLRPVLEGSTAKDTRTSLPVDAEALAHLFDRMQAGRVAPGTKLLPLLSEIMAFGAKMAGDGQRPSFGTDCRWMVVNQQDANAANRLAALSQGSGWCVASSDMADYYLGDSEFHLLVEGGRAKVALRLSGNQAVEVQGHNNQDPGHWWPRILLYCAARGTQITHRHDAARSQAQIIRQELVAAQKTTRRLGELLKAQPAKVHLVTSAEELDDASRLVVQEAWLACVRADPLCGGLLPGWMEADPAVKQATLEAWVALLITDPLSCEHVPGALIADEKIQAALKPGWIGLLKRDVMRWNQCPEILQQEFSKDVDFIQTFRTTWKELLKRDVTRWNQCPEILQQKFIKDGGFIQTFRTTWKELLKRDVTRWNQCPEILQQEFSKNGGFIQTFRTGWKELIKRDGSKWNSCPECLQQDAEVIQARKIGWMELLKRDVSKWNTCPEFLQQDVEVICARKTGWIELLKRDVNQWNTCPDFLQKEDAVKHVYEVSSYAQSLGRGIENIPEPIKSDPVFIDVVANRYHHQVVGHSHDYFWYRKWRSLPDVARQNPKLRSIHKESWIKLLRRRPSIWDRAPDFVLEDKKVRTLLREKIDIQKLYSQCSAGANDLLPSLLGDDYDCDRALKTLWIERMKCDVTQWNACPEFLQECEEVIFARKEGWMDLLKRDVTQWNQCPEFLQNDKDLIQAHTIGWMGLLKRDVTQWNVCPDFLQKEFQLDDKFIQKFKTYWMYLLKRDVTKWNACPDFLQQDEEVIHAFKTGWMDLLKLDVTTWNTCPEFLQKDMGVIDILKNRWVELLRCDISQYYQCPELLRHHAEVKTARVEGEIHWIQSQNPERREFWARRLVDQKIVPVADLPPDLSCLIQDHIPSSQRALPTLPSDPLPAYVTACFNALLQQPQATLSIVQVWKHSPRMELARCAQALAALREQPWNFSALPADQQSHPLIHEAAVEGWVLFVTKHPYFQPQVPESLRSHPKLQTTLASLCEAEKKAPAKQVLEEVTKHPGLSDAAMSDLKLPTKEKQTWKQVTALRMKHWKKQVKADARAWEKVPKSLQQEDDLLKIMREGIGPQIRQNPTLWNQLPVCYQNDPCLQRVHRFATRA